MMAVERRAGPSKGRLKLDLQLLGLRTALRSSPTPVECSDINVVLWFAKSTGNYISARIWKDLELCFCVHEVVDEGPERSVLTRGILVDDVLKNEGRVA